MVNPETILQGLAQLTNWGILTTDEHLTITGWNHWLEVNSGRPATEAIGRPLAEIYPDLESRRILPFFRQALDGRVVLLSQLLHRYLFAMPSTIEGVDLGHMQQSVRIAPLNDGERVVGTLTVIEDVSDRVANDAELALRTRQQATLAALGQQALVGGDIVELSDRSAAAAAAAVGVEFCGVWEAAPKGHDMFLRSGVGWKAGVIGAAKWPAALAENAGVPNIPVNLKEETSNALPCLKEHGIVSGISVPIAREGRTFGVVGAYTCRERTFADEDIHVLQAIANVLGLAIERKRLEAELVGRVSQLAEADARKDEFLAMLAHELRNPLAPIRNSVRLLRLKAEPTVDELNYARSVIERQLQNLTRLVDDLLDVSRITRGKVVLQKETVGLASVIERAVEVSRPLIDQRKHRLTLTIPREPILVFADSIRLAQVIANLLNNAAKYTEEQGRIDLIVERTQQEAVIRIVDTGVGIAPNMLSSVFDLFTQAQGSVSRSEGGLGIGLSLVRSLVQMHDGVVTATSAGLGHGCQFEVRLPIRQAGSMKAPGPQPILPEKIPSRRILVVDDNVDAADSLAMLLRVIGHDVRTAHDGPAALETARASRPEVVLLDIGLPYMSGLEVARHLRNDFPADDVVLVALTGYGQDEDRRRSEEAGFDGHLVKPVDFDALQSLIAQMPQRSGKRPPVL